MPPALSERCLQDTERLCVFLMDQALEQMLAEGRTQTILTVFDLRGFKCATEGDCLCVQLC